MNTEKYIQTMTWLQTLTGLLEHMQVCALCVCNQLWRARGIQPSFQRLDIDFASAFSLAEVLDCR